MIINPLGSVRFDLANDMFKEIIRAPASLQSRESCYYGYHCCVVKNCLSFAAMFEDDHSIELWVMKEYGLEASWTKLYWLGLFHALQNPRRWLSAFEVGFNGEAVVHEDRHLLVLHPRSSGEDFDIVLDGQTVLFDGCYVNYRESLVQISQD